MCVVGVRSEDVIRSELELLEKKEKRTKLS